MRVFLLAAMCGLAFGQNPDPAYEPLERAYRAVKETRYDDALAAFRQAIAIAPGRAAVHKDFAYTLLKAGENAAARDEFAAAMRLDAADEHVALEYAFLCYETRKQAEARRIFLKLRRSGNAEVRKTAGQAFENVDGPLREGIARWQKALAIGKASFTAHYELAGLAEQRDELVLAAGQYEKAWRILPERRSVLVDLGRVWHAAERHDEAKAAWLSASRAKDPRTAVRGRELLPERYPLPYEFANALRLDPGHAELRREYAYLLLEMKRQAEAEVEFRIITDSDPGDVLSAAQLGFLRLARKDEKGAMPLLELVLKGGDTELANRVRAVLRLPQVSAAPKVDARDMAERSIKAGYLKDALKYLLLAYDGDPYDYRVMAKLGWSYNMLRDDRSAARWYSEARKSPDPAVARPAQQAYRNLRSELAAVQWTAWLYPFYSSRWRDVFSYGQVKAVVNVKSPVRPYFSVRYIGDTRGSLRPDLPLYLSESAFILAAGVETRSYHGARGWFEAGNAMGYRTGHLLPDYRGGVGLARGFGQLFRPEARGFFFETANDAVFISRFGNDVLGYTQNHLGFTFSSPTWLAQVFAIGNLTADSKRESWANFAEVGAGAKVRWAAMPAGMFLEVNVAKGRYLLGNRGTFQDIRAGFWYAVSR